MKKLIINADDYGLSKKFNKGVVESVKKGTVTSTTVMINRKFVRPKELLQFKNISIGLHLELKEKATLREINNQIKKFENKLKQLPSHLDGHKHCHLTKNNLPKVIKVAKKYKLPIRSKISDDRKIIEENKIKTPNEFISWHPKKKDKLFNKLKNIKSSTAELVCHPGYFDEKCTVSYNKQREKELKTLKSKKLRDLIKKYKLVNYKQID